MPTAAGTESDEQTPGNAAAQSLPAKLKIRSSVSLDKAGRILSADGSPKSLFSDALKGDKSHYAEHYVIEHVLEHVENIFKSPGDAELSPEQRQERREVFAQLRSITNSMDDQHVLLDLDLVHEDHTENITIQDITAQMLVELTSNGVLDETQRLAAKMSVDASRWSQRSLGSRSPQSLQPAMAHRLAVPLIYADLTKANGTAPKTDGTDTICAFARLKHGTHLGETDGEGIRYVFLLLEHEPAGEAAKHIDKQGKSDGHWRRLGRQHVSAAEAIAFVMHDVDTYDHLFLAKNAKDVHDAIQQYMESHAAWEDGMKVGAHRLSQNEIGLTWEPDKLPFGGLKRDAARRICTKVWLRDWSDGLTPQSIAVVLYMFFACLAPAIAFGSLLDKATGGDPGERLQPEGDARHQRGLRDPGRRARRPGVRVRRPHRGHRDDPEQRPLRHTRTPSSAARRSPFSAAPAQCWSSRSCCISSHARSKSISSRSTRGRACGSGSCPSCWP